MINDKGEPRKLKDDEYYKNQNKIDVLKAKFCQIFLLDEKDGKFESNKKKVLDSFNKFFIVEQNDAEDQTEI